MLACPNCEWEKVESFKVECYDILGCEQGAWKKFTEHERLSGCLRTKRREELMRQAIGYWNDYTRYECRKETR